MSRPNYARHLCVSVDVGGYSGRDDRRQADTQSDLVRMLDLAAGSAGLDRGQWRTQPTGDGELALVPLDGSEPAVLDDFVRHLDHELARYNQDRVPAAKIRLRMAIHQGPAYEAANGFAGEAVVIVSRLLDSTPVRAALTCAHDANLALIISDKVYGEVIRGGHTTYQGKDFRRTTVRVKEHTSDAWVRVPGYDIHRLSLDSVPRPEDAPTQPTAATGGGAVNQAGQDIHTTTDQDRPAADPRGELIRPYTVVPSRTEYHFDGPVHAPGGTFGPNFGQIVGPGEAGGNG